MATPDARDDAWVATRGLRPLVCLSSPRAGPGRAAGILVRSFKRTRREHDTTCDMKVDSPSLCGQCVTDLALGRDRGIQPRTAPDDTQVRAYSVPTSVLRMVLRAAARPARMSGIA